MTRLLLINGLPGSGKSTLAARYCADRPLSVCLDIDVVRSLIGGGLDRPVEAGLLARRMALSMAGDAIPRGHDVVVPQLLARTPFIEELHSTADGLGAQFCEVVLLEPPEKTVERLRRRGRAPESRAPYDAHVLLERENGLAALPELHRRLLDVLEQRPHALVVEPVLDDVEQTYRQMLALLPADRRRT